ncbi:MAG TPA: hypothetical protein VGI50_07205 [Solirubrobacteraceae bacterium]
MTFVRGAPDRYAAGVHDRPVAGGPLAFRLPDRVVYGDSHRSLVDQLLNAGTLEPWVAGKAGAPLPTAGHEAFSEEVTHRLQTLGVGSLKCGDPERTR